MDVWETVGNEKATVREVRETVMKEKVTVRDVSDTVMNEKVTVREARETVMDYSGTVGNVPGTIMDKKAIAMEQKVTVMQLKRERKWISEFFQELTKPSDLSRACRGEVLSIDYESSFKSENVMSAFGGITPYPVRLWRYYSLSCPPLEGARGRNR
ncbi:hypothetical protein JXQ70_16270 [bacterium]|nr:hypothetical protein [bacterium]